MITVFFRRPASSFSLTMLLTALLLLPAQANSQNTSVDDDRERLTAERFLQVLMKRPRPGTSLDRVYGYHVRSGSLDGLLKALEKPKDNVTKGFNLQDADRGPAMMVLGLLQLQRGKSAAAVKALKSAEELLPKDAACSFYLGKAHLAIGETELAAAAMERAIERGPARNEALPIFTELGRIYGRAGAAQKALSVWTRLEQQFPGDSRVGGQIANTLADEGNVEEALKRFEALSKSARKDEDKIAFAIQAAEMKRRLGQPAEATSALEAILNKLRPGSWLYTDVRNRIEDGFLKSGDVDALADYYQERLKNDENNLELMTRLGRILVSASRLEEASTILQTAVERAPEDVEVRLGLVDVLVRQANVSEAGKQYEQLAKQDPTNPDYLLKWGQLLLEDQSQELADRRAAAAKIWQQLADARNDDAVTLAQVADRLRSVNRTDDAIDLYRKAIEIDPTAPQYREYLGEYFHQLDRKDEAIATWETIAGEDRRSVASFIRLAEIFATFKLPERSLETWKTAAEFDFTFSQEMRYANQLRAAKQFDEALARLKIAEKIAETPDERDQILSDRITTYSEAGTLPDMIAVLEKNASPETNQLKELALMHQAAGQLTDAFIVILKALEKEPENIAVLSVAAEVLERQNRFSDASTYYRKLANVDRRFQTNYLEKVAQLQIRLGLSDQALKTSEELIQANPASTDTYLFAARTAFQLGRTDEGIEVLRRAMTVARRDNGPRKLLASEFAKQYRTDEAIDLYWQALDFESKLDKRIDIVRSLAPLYERRTEVETLLSRIEDLGAKDNDVRATQMMIAAANEAIQDYGAARQAIDRLLARQPRDVSLLESMVRLCDAANELELAIEFQQRIVTLADTPENRYRLVNLQLDAGTIDIKAVLSQRMSMAKDPSRLMSMIQSATRRGDKKTAAFVAREAIKNDDSLWDIKLVLAQVLLHETIDEDPVAPEAEDGTDEGNEATQPKTNPHDEAVAICKQVLTANVPLDDVAPTSKGAKSTSRSTSSRTSASSWGQSGYQLARQYQLAQYGRYNYGRQQGVQTISPNSFGHAKILAQALIWVPKAKSLTNAEFKIFLEEELQQYALPENLDKVINADTIWKYQAVVSTASSMVEGALKVDQLSAEATAKRTEQIAWKLFELAPKAGSGRVMSLLQQRLVMGAASKGENSGKSKQDPLNDSRLELLVKFYDTKVAEIKKNPKASRSALLGVTAVLRHEFEVAGKTDIAKKYQPEDISDNASFRDILAGIRFHLSLGNTDKANKLVPRLLTTVRTAQKNGAAISGLSQGSLNGTLASLGATNTASTKFLKDNRLQLLDALIAATVHNQAVRSRRQRAISTGKVQVYHQSATGSYRSAEVAAPLSPELMDESLAREITSLNQATLTDAESNKVSRIDDQILQHLLKPLPDAPVYEQKARSASAAFAYWWKDQPQQCYHILSSMSERYPDDVNIRIEHARLASELGNDREALDILNSFEPLDSKMLVRKEMAALNLAARVSDEKRAAQAAERLFGMRMDTRTQLALSAQLRQLGMKNKAAAVLQRLRGGRKQDDSTRLQIARSFMTAGDKEAAAEVAFQVLRNVNRSRNQQGNVDYYRSQSISILKSANRLDPLIAMAKRRVESAPKSIAARTELAELYTAAGKKAEADKLWAEISKDAPTNPAQLITQAKGLVQAQKNKEAIPLFLKAFQKEPQLIGNHYYELQNAVRQANAWDEMYTGLLKIPANRIPEYRIDEFINGDYNNRSKDFSDAKIKFVIHVMQAGSAGSSLNTILSKVTEKQKEQYPQIRQAIIKTVTNDGAFQPNSQTWSIQSYQGNGKVNGGVQSVVEFLAADKEARTEFEKAVEKQLKKTETGEAYMARFIAGLVQLKVGEESEIESVTQELLAVLAELESSFAVDSVPANQGNWNGRLPEAFLWQAGNLINTIDGIPDKSNFLLTVYESAKLGEIRVNGGDPRYSILYPMIEEYKKSGRPEQAVQRLMKAYRNLDNSEQNQYNPGYGDYQDLQSWKWIAEQLQSCNAPFQSLAIYRRALGDLSKFEKAKRWGGSLSPEPYQVGAKKAAASINEESAIQFLESQLIEITAEKSNAHTLDLMMLPIASFEEAEVVPGFLMAINEAKKSDLGIGSLKQLAKALQKQSTKENSDWSLTAAQLMIAAAIDSENTQELSDQLLKRLPDLKQIQTNPTQQTPYLDCFAVGLALSQSDHADSKPVVEKIKTILTAIVTEKSDSAALLVLETRFGDPAKAIDLLLTELESNLEGGAPNKNQVALALKIALTSAKDKNWIASTRAIKAALGQGSPLVGISTNTRGDAFAITDNRSSSNGNEPTDHRAILNAQVLDLVAVYRQHLQLERQRSDSWRAANISPQTMKDAQLIFDALLKIVIPQSKSSLVAMYEREIASSRNHDQIRNGKEGVEPRSAAMTLVEVADMTKRFDDVTNRLSERIQTESAASSILRIQIALKKDDREKLTEAIKDFEALVDDVLPSADAQMVSTGGSYSISSSMQTESYEKSRVLNQVMYAVWDVSQQQDLKDTPASAAADRILRRAIALIGSDRYTQQRHRQILDILRSRSAQQAAQKGNQSLLSSIIQGMSQSIARDYSGSNPEYMVQAQKRSLTAVLFPMIEAGNVAQSHGVIRQIIESESKIRRNYKSAEAATVMRAICELPKDQQYDLLKKITFGSRKDAPILHWMGFVRASEVPELVRKQTPDFGKHKSIPLCLDVVPVTDTALILAHLAVELGDADALLKQIADHGQSDQRTAKLLTALVTILRDGDAASDQLSGFFTALLKTLRENNPPANDRNLQLPELEFLVITQAIRAGVIPELADPLTNLLKTYSMKAQQYEITAAIGVVRTKAGIGRAAGGSAASPLRHFIPVSVPWYQGPESLNMRPLHAINHEGWVSSSGGYNMNLLMLKYPVSGSFTLDALLRDGSYGDSDISYGGTLYRIAGWNSAARVSVLRGGPTIQIPVTSIKKGQANREGLRITPETITVLCNDVPCLEDYSSASYPWACVSQNAYRTTQWKDFRIAGNPIVPSEVNLLDPMLRGWTAMGYGGLLPPTVLPTKDGKKPERPDRTNGNGYEVKDHEMILQVKSGNEQADPGGFMQYLRPLLHNETVSWQFFWKTDVSEIHPMVGRVTFLLSEKGTVPTYAPAVADLSTTHFIPPAQLKPPQKPIAGDVIPKEGEWNKISMTRKQDTVQVQLNGQTIAELPVTDQTARFGFSRPQGKSCRIKEMILIGDWPETLPANLMEKAE